MQHLEKKRTSNYLIEQCYFIMEDEKELDLTFIN